MSRKSVADKDQVARDYLNSMYGLPVDSVRPDVNMCVTIPLYVVKGCNKGPKHILDLPGDIQARLAALLVTLKMDSQTIQSRQWVSGFNSPNLKAGDVTFVTLPSFKKR